MNQRIFLIFVEESTESSTDKLKQSLQNLLKSPFLYIVLGVIVLVIIAVYLFHRIVKPELDTIKVVLRKGKMQKLVDEKSSFYFLVPFIDTLWAVILLNEKELSSDKLYVNNSPDALYKINYTLTYTIIDVSKFFPKRESFTNEVISKINDSVREYADQGHVLEIIEKYRDNSDKLVSLLNSVMEEYGAKATSFKINFIEPLGKKWFDLENCKK